MAAWPPHSPRLPPECRAPPPSPVATRRPEPVEDDKLAEFLSGSSRVPELVLPDHIFPRQATVVDPPVIDMASLISTEDRESTVDIIKSAAALMGCFQVVNHGISDDMIGFIEAFAAALFRLSPEKKKLAAKSPERMWGFEVEEGKGEVEEFFWWCGRREEEMVRIWPNGYKEFSDKVERLSVEMEKIGRKIEEIILEKVSCNHDKPMVPRRGGSVLCIHKHGPNSTNCARHDMLSMLISSTSSSNALGLHIRRGPRAFHLYSKRGRATFCPDDGALVVTVGDQIQARSGGLYKCVIGKPVVCDKGNNEGPISIAFLYSTPSMAIIPSCNAVDREKTISLPQQVMLAVCLTLLYHIIYYIYSKA